MPQIADVVLNDSVDDRTFTPRDITAGVATLIESTGVPVGDNRLTVSLVRTSSGRYKTTYKFALPQVQDVTVNGIVKPTIVRTAYVDVVMTFDESSSQSERGEAVKLTESLLGHSMVWDVSSWLKSLY